MQLLRRLSQILPSSKAAVVALRSTPKLMLSRQARPARTRQVLLVRHAESEHNVAERRRDLRGLLLQEDHGITPRGWDQCEALRERIRGTSAGGAWARDDIEVYASPLTRATQTALLALADVPGARRITLLPDARELGAGPLYGRDCLGAAVGASAIRDRARSAAIRAARGDAARLLSYDGAEAATALDASRCETEWWSSFEPRALARCAEAHPFTKTPVAESLRRGSRNGIFLWLQHIPQFARPLPQGGSTGP